MKYISPVLFSVVFLLSACTQTEPVTESAPTELLQKVRSEQRLKKDILLEIKETTNSQDMVEVQIVLKNPSEQKIQSIRSWMSFPPDILQGTHIAFPQQEHIALIAPGEQEFDNTQGVVKIGFSLDKDFSVPAEMILATISFQKLKNETAALTFFDVQDQGHTQVLILHEGTIRNAMHSPLSDPLVIEKIIQN